MESALPSAAERYLDRLERALWGLPSQERGAILLELRGHLAARAETAGETIAALGAPERLAQDFLAAGAGGGGPAALPEAETPRRFSLHAVLNQVLATWRGSREG
ncbi:MAG: HAAS signaling domain-containing protein, partial [Allosphingosinicella sp.]